ncbi:hypothetical protein IC582_009369 [Cucumis melo]
MAQRILVIYFLSLVLVVNAGVPFDFFQFVQQWGLNVCNTGAHVSPCHTPPRPMFTIHGLWPSNHSNAHLVCWSKTQYSKVISLEAQLKIYWPDLISGNNDKFWGHEWDNHGKCSDPPFGLFQYFQISLNLRKQFDLLAILTAAGLNPQSSNDLVIQDIITPIQKITKTEPGIRCNKNGRTGKLQLYEIVLCLEKDGVTLIDCPSFVSGTCPTKFVWLLPQENSFGASDYP